MVQSEGIEVVALPDTEEWTRVPKNPKLPIWVNPESRGENSSEGGTLMSNPIAPLDVHAATTKSALLPIRPDTLAQLQELAGEHNQSVMAYLADSVAIHRWFDKQLKDGGKIIAKPKGSRARVITAR